ncbi:hypothetical protein QGM61_14085 [Pseudohongiella sp. SYSU M77423]|uniref:hypothetical protein n=1 Tax=Pseudohongiella sp. SYSU M77423 TaxID=3042312 RepID=UPI00248071C0|nr:hypothetical protein [Pseudohongiella sp. SYSU M77423]MDH7944953.1 hypothetical protein [Pseudohongiella sp. SYSU M77423]
MNNNQRFVKKRLAQYVAASLIAGMSTQALANDFTINNGQLTISNDNSFSQTVTVGANGIVGSVDNVPVSNNFGIPNFSFDLVNSATTPTNGTYTFEVAVAIQSDSVSTRRFEAYLGNLTLTVNGSTVTGTIANQDLVVLARDGAVNATAVISNNSASNGAVTISGGSVTFSGSNLVNRLVNANAAFQTILNAFNAGGSYTYTVAIEQTTGAQATRFGRIVNGTFSPFPRVQTECSLATNSQLSNVFTLNGTVNNAPYAIRTLLSSAYAVQGKFGVQQAASSGALTAFTEDCTEQTTGGGGGGGNNGGGEVVVPVEQLQEQAEQLDSLAEQIANNPGNVPEAVIQQIDQATDNAVQNIGNVIARFEQGTEVNTGNLLATLEVAAKASSTSSTASGSGTGNQSLAQKSSSLLTNSAAALTSLAAQSQSGNAPALTATQVTQVRTATTNLLSTASTLSTQSTSTTDIASAARAAAEVINANRRLNVAADAALVTSVSNASAQIATAAIRAVAGANVSDAEITTLLQQNQGLAEQVLNLALPIPPSQVTTRAERNNQIGNTAAGANMSAAARARLADATRDNFVVPTAVVVNGVNVLEKLRNLFRGSGTQGFSLAIIDETGRFGGIAGTSHTTQADIIVDDVTGAVKVVLPGETYAGAIVAVKSVPSTVPNGIRVRRDGRTVIVTDGVAVELAPMALDVVAFGAAVESAGYEFSTRDNGSIGLNLGSGNTFSGTFAYDNLTSANISTCGGVSFVEPTQEVNTADYSFGIKCSNGATQRVVPYPSNTSFFESVAAAGLTANADRSSGFITISGVGVLKPSFFVSPRTAAEVTYYDANKDSFGLAYQAMDVNADGKMDYKVISATGTQLFYGVN